MTAREPNHLFVYGTLMRAGRSPYGKLLRTRATFVGEAWARGRLYALGAFPGAVFEPEAAGKVYGEVFRLGGTRLLDLLDAYEGCSDGGRHSGLFKRVTISVTLSGGGECPAWVYAYAGPAAGRVAIASGRFRIG